LIDEGDNVGEQQQINGMIMVKSESNMSGGGQLNQKSGVSSRNEINDDDVYGGDEMDSSEVEEVEIIIDLNNMDLSNMNLRQVQQKNAVNKNQTEPSSW
jgi:hypothetical protein